MSLSFPRNESSVSLHSLLEGFFREETLAEDYFCSNCKSTSTHKVEPRLSRRKLSLFKLPRVLVVHLKRFAYGRWKKEKVSTQVSFSERLELSKYLHR